MAKFYICEHCKNLVEKLQNSGIPVVCCGQPMTEIKENTVDASTEKHMPVISSPKEGVVRVKVGDIPHPMMEEHFIQFIYLETNKGIQRKMLRPGEEPEAVFFVGNEQPGAVYEYCNIHGLWKNVF